MGNWVVDVQEHKSLLPILMKSFSAQSNCLTGRMKLTVSLSTFPPPCRPARVKKKGESCEKSKDPLIPVCIVGVQRRWEASGAMMRKRIYKPGPPSYSSSIGNVALASLKSELCSELPSSFPAFKKMCVVLL
jgi:hypothetical protein